MKAIIFAAGIGSRLGELTKNTPKCLMIAGGKTLLQHSIEKVKTAGVTDVVINLFHLPEQIANYVDKNRSFGINITFSFESELLDTGGGLLKTRDFFEGESAFILHNSDVFCDINLAELVKLHLKNGNVATLAVMERISTRGLLFNNDMKLVGWSEERSSSPVPYKFRYPFCGIHVASSKIFDYMPEGPKKFSIIEPYLSASRAGNTVEGYLLKDGYWMDVGTPERLAELDRKLS